MNSAEHSRTCEQLASEEKATHKQIIYSLTLRIQTFSMDLHNVLLMLFDRGPSL